MKTGNNTHPPRSPQTRALAKALREAYHQYHSWRETARRHAITTPSGQPNPGLAWRIAKQKYDPHSPALRERLCLPPIKQCPECHRTFKPKPAMKTWHHLDDLNKSEIEYLLSHREIV